MHPIELHTRSEMLAELLPAIPNPLHTAIQCSPYRLWLPANWFHITTADLYTEADRAFTPKMRIYDPNLLRRFVEADINVLCRDLYITANDLQNFAWRKYQIQEQEMMELLGKPSTPQMLRDIAGTPALTTLREPLYLFGTHAREAKPYTLPHYIPSHFKHLFPRTDPMTNPRAVEYVRMDTGSSRLPTIYPLIESHINSIYPISPSQQRPPYNATSHPTYNVMPHMLPFLTDPLAQTQGRTGTVRHQACDVQYQLPPFGQSSAQSMRRMTQELHAQYPNTPAPVPREAVSDLPDRTPNTTASDREEQQQVSVPPPQANTQDHAPSDPTATVAPTQPKHPQPPLKFL